MISVRLASQLSVYGKDNVIFSDIMIMINVKLCMMVVNIEFYLFFPLSVTFQGHSSVKQYKLKNLSYLIKLKLCMIVDYIK